MLAWLDSSADFLSGCSLTVGLHGFSLVHAEERGREREAGSKVEEVLWFIFGCPLKPHVIIGGTLWTVLDYGLYSWRSGLSEMMSH